MRELYLGWIAALIDGEGTISLGKGHYHSDAVRPSKRGFCWIPSTRVSNTCKELLQHFQEITGFGHLIAENPPSLLSKTGKIRYDLLLRNNEQLILLPQIKDLLIAKKNQAEFLIEALEILKAYHNLWHIEEITAVRDRRLEAIYWEIKPLNARGRGGKERVLAEISKLPSDPRAFTKERYEAEMKKVLDTERDKIFKIIHRRKACELTSEQREQRQKWREEHKDWIRDYNRKRWQKEKQRLESDPVFATEYRRKVAERQRRYQASKRLQKG